MARIKRVAVPAAKQEEIRERVARGTSSTIYQVPISRPAQVVERQSDPETVRSYSDVSEAQIAKVTSGLSMYILTVAVLAGLAYLASEVGGFELPAAVILLVHVLLVIAAIPVALPGGLAWWTVGALAVIAVTIASYVLTDGTLLTWTVICMAVAALNWKATPKIVSGLEALGKKPSLDEILWTHHEDMEVFDDDPEQRPAPAGIAIMNLPGDKPIFGSNPYFLYPQIEDFCFAAMSERYNDRGKPMSGLSRHNMVEVVKAVGPPNGSISDRPVSRLKISRDTYDIIINGLVAAGLVQKIDGVGTVWSKIAPGTSYTCGWSIDEIRRILRQYASEPMKGNQL